MRDLPTDHVINTDITLYLQPYIKYMHGKQCNLFKTELANITLQYRYNIQNEEERFTIF